MGLHVAEGLYSAAEYSLFTTSFFLHPALLADDAVRVAQGEGQLIKASGKSDEVANAGKSGSATTKTVAGNKCTGAHCQIQCFTAGTLVSTEHGLIPIEDVQPGDKVLAANDITGEIGYRTVARTFVTPDKPVFTLHLDSENGTLDIGVTEEPPFWVVGKGWTPASELQNGDELFTSHGGWVRVSGSTWELARQTVYNMEVEGFHTFFVGTERVLVHNTCVDDVVKAANGSLGRGVEGINNARLTQSEAVEVINRIVSDSGRQLMSTKLAGAEQGTVVLSGVRYVPGGQTHVVVISKDGTTRIGTATAKIDADFSLSVFNFKPR